MGGKKGGGKGGGGQITAPDPQEIIGDQLTHNRLNQTTPFGSVRFEDGEQIIEASPGMQGLIDRSIGLAGQDSQRFEAPDYVNQIGNALAGRLGDRLGAELTPHTKPQQQQPMADPSQIPGMQPPEQMTGDIAGPVMNQPPAMNAPTHGVPHGNLGGGSQSLGQLAQLFRRK